MNKIIKALMGSVLIFIIVIITITITVEKKAIINYILKKYPEYQIRYSEVEEKRGYMRYKNLQIEYDEVIIGNLDKLEIEIGLDNIVIKIENISISEDVKMLVDHHIANIVSVKTKWDIYNSSIVRLLINKKDTIILDIEKNEIIEASNKYKETINMMGIK